MSPEAVMIMKGFLALFCLLFFFCVLVGFWVKEASNKRHMEIKDLFSKEKL